MIDFFYKNYLFIKNLFIKNIKYYNVTNPFDSFGIGKI